MLATDNATRAGVAAAALGTGLVLTLATLSGPVRAELTSLSLAQQDPEEVGLSPEDTFWIQATEPQVSAGRKGDADLMRGAWQPVQFFDNGKEYSRQDAQDMQVFFGSGTAVFDTNIQESARRDADVMRFHLDPTQRPKRITFTRGEGAQQRQFPGIYEPRGDTLRIAFSERPQDSADRPMDFTVEQGEPDKIVVALERASLPELNQQEQQLQGSWKVVSGSEGGDELSLDMKTVRALIVGQQFVLEPMNEEASN